MSFRGTPGNFGRSVPRVSQIFKKRSILFDQDVPINSNGTLVATIQLQETGTLYAIKLSLTCDSNAGTGGDNQRITLWVRCAPADSAVPDFTDSEEQQTLNGFSPATLFGVAQANLGIAATYLNEKFRFRRKCDRLTEVELFAQSTTVRGTGRVCTLSGLMQLIIRMR